MALVTTPDFLKQSMSDATLRLSHVDFQMRSAFTRQRQVLAWPSAAQWQASFTVPLLHEPEAGEMRAFLAALRGRVNTFNMPVPGYLQPTNDYEGPAGVVKGAAQTGYSLLTDGWTPSVQVLPAGAYFTVNGELKITTAAATADGAGEVTLAFEPALRASPSDNAALVIVNPYALMSLSDSDQAAWAVRSPKFHSFTLAAEEALDA